MPSTSRAQHGYAAMSSTPEGRAKLKAEGRAPMPLKIARDYLKADKGRNLSKLPQRTGKKGLINGG